MTKEWIEPIYDRTYNDVLAVQYDPNQVNSKGCWNVADLNRIENNTAYCAEYMLENKIVRSAPSIVPPAQEWTSDIIPTKDEIDRILNNVRLLVELSSSNPAIADQLPTIYAATQINYVLANEIEFALELMHNQPKLPLVYWQVKLNNGVVKTVLRDDGSLEVINSDTALVAEDEVVTITGVEYGEYAQYQNFTYWSGQAEDIGLLEDYQSKETVFVMPYRAIELTANFETHVPRSLTLTNGYISVNKDPTAETGPRTGTYFAGDEVMIIADVAVDGKAFYNWTGTEEAIENIIGTTYDEDPSTCLLTMPDCDVELAPHYINAGRHLLTVTGGNGTGYYNYNDYVFISAVEPDERHKFSHWSGNTSYLTDINDPHQSFRMSDFDMMFTANFTYIHSYNGVQIINGYISIDDTNVTEADGLEELSTYTLIPTPPSGLVFDYWELEGYGSITGNTFTVGDGNAIITGHYAPMKTLTVINKNNDGSASTYSIVQGHSYTISTDATVGNYRFNGWYENGVKVSELTTYSVTMGDTDKTIEARYDYYGTYTVTLVNKDNAGQTTTAQVLAGGNWSSSTSEEVGDYLLVGWVSNGEQISTSTSCGFQVNDNITVEVIYRPKETYYLTVVNGQGSGYYKERQAVTITTEEENFSKWSYSNLYSITSLTSHTTVVKLGRADGSVTAEHNLKKITVIRNDGTHVYDVATGDSKAIAAGPAPDEYEFKEWEITSGDATLANMYASSTQVYAHSQDSIITATYKAIPKFTVTMENGYVQNGENWVETASLLRGATSLIRMKPAPTGQLFLQWEVYENGVLQTDANDIQEPLAERTRLRNLTRNITIKATYYVPDPLVKYTLTIERKDGSVEQYDYPAGTDIDVRASYPDSGMEFYKWTGDTAYVAGGVYNEITYVHMPAQAIQIKENFVPEGYIPEFDVVMTNLYGECCYTTESEDPDTHEVITTEHWVPRHSYPEGTEVRIRAVGIPNEYYFDTWSAINHDTEDDARSLITNLSEDETTILVPDYDIDVEPNITLKDTYQLLVNNGGTSAYYYEGARADVYFEKEDTNDVHYQFIRWVGTNVSQLRLYDGGMFKVLVPGDVNNPQYIKMPNQRTEITGTYKSLYRLSLTNGTIDSISEGDRTKGYYEANTTVNITANEAPTGMRFQYWSGNTAGLSSIYDPTATVKTTTGVTVLQAVYSTDADRNDIGYTSMDLKSMNTVDNNLITVVSGVIEKGFIITDITGHIYIVTNVDSGTNISTIYRMTKIVQGGDIYG